MHARWRVVLEVSAERGDSFSFLTLERALPQVARLVLCHHDRVCANRDEYNYWLRLLKQVDWKRGCASDWVEYKFGTLLHREDGPAREFANGKREWWLYGKRHRQSGPAVIHPQGTQEWWMNGVLHRENGPAIVTTNTATHVCMYYGHGHLYRIDERKIVQCDDQFGYERFTTWLDTAR